MLTKTYHCLLALLFFMGILLAGSEADPPLWPWNVVAGAVCLALFYLATRRMSDLDDNLRPDPRR